MLALDFADLHFQCGTELLAHVEPQAIGEEQASARRHIGQAGHVSAWQGLLLDPLLEKFRGIPQPGSIDMLDGPHHRFSIRRLRYRGQGVQNRCIGPPASLGVRLRHVGRCCPGQRRCG